MIRATFEVNAKEVNIPSNLQSWEKLSKAKAITTIKSELGSQ